MKKIAAILLPFVLYSLSAIAQPPAFPDNGIYISDTDFINHRLAFPFNKSTRKDTVFKNPIGHYHELWIKTRNSTYKFFDDDIWGYRQNGNDYRLYKSDPYKITYAGRIIIYSIPSTPGNGNGSTIFFSKDIQSPVHDLTRKLLLDAYHSDSVFVARVQQLKWSESIYKWNKKLQRYEFIDWLK
jgi:hypothetical protein